MRQSLTALARILVQPADVYPLLRERSPLLWPMLLVVLASLITGFMLVPALETTVRQQLAAQPDLPGEAAEVAGRIGVWAAIAGGALGPLAYVLVTAAVLALGLLFTGGSLPFRQALSLALFAYAPLLVKGLVLGGLALAGVVTDVIRAVTSAALLLSPERAGTLTYRLLNLIDPLEWWHIALLAGGVRALAGTTPRVAWTLAVAVWVLLYASFKLLAPMP